MKPDDIQALKTKFGFDAAATFAVPDAVTKAYADAAKRGAVAEFEWNSLFEKYAEKYPKEHAELARRISGELPTGWEKSLPVYTPADPAQASRKLSEIVLQAITPVLPDLLGGSADLTGSNLTRVKNIVDFQPPSTGLGTYAGIYVRYGVREHAMGAIMNGIAAYGGIIPFAGTFLVCSCHHAHSLSSPFNSELRQLCCWCRPSFRSQSTSSHLGRLVERPNIFF